MSTTFKLKYDPTEAQAGFKLLAQSIRAAARGEEDVSLGVSP